MSGLYYYIRPIWAMETSGVSRTRAAIPGRIGPPGISIRFPNVAANLVPAKRSIAVDMAVPCYTAGDGTRIRDILLVAQQAGVPLEK